MGKKTEKSKEEENIVFFNALDTKGKGYLVAKDIQSALEHVGIKQDDPRIKEIVHALKKFEEKKITPKNFNAILKNNSVFMQKVLQGDLIIPDFEDFCSTLEQVYKDTCDYKDGHVADYIPQLARVNPEQYAVAACTVDGQRYSIGDSEVLYCVQSTCKPINYCIALEEHREEKVHQHVGHEPSGQSFNELTLNGHGLPHNPMINAGAIMSCSLIKPKLAIADRFDHVIDMWSALAGGKRVGFNNSVYLSERQTADRNFALGYFMRENKAFPKGTNLVEILEFYFQCCSIEITCEIQSVVAATLANGGICPTTGKRVLKPKTVQNCLSLMYSCGMYDFSGEFAFSIGVPAKSGVSGAVMIVIPNVTGLCVWSPRLDRMGNSVRGIEFCKKLVETYNFHNYDSLLSLESHKKDPRKRRFESKLGGVMALCWAVSQGDLEEIKQLVARGHNINEGDYDGRTPLHLAASEGHSDVVEYFLAQNVKVNPKDRWGGTPLEDAYRHKHKKIIKLLEKNGAKR